MISFSKCWPFFAVACKRNGFISFVQMPGMFMKIMRTKWWQVQFPTCFLLAWLRIRVQRLSGFLSFWKSCCNSFLTCKHEVKVQSKASNLVKWKRDFFPIAPIKSFNRIRCCKRISSGTSANTFSTDSFWPSMSWSLIAYWVKYFSTTVSDSLLKRG